MRQKINKLLIFALCLVTIFLSGCTNQVYTLVVNENDSSTFTVRYVVDKDTYDLLSSYDIDRNYNFEQQENSQNKIEQCDVLFQETAAVFYDNGFKINPINDSIQIGFEAEKQYASPEELNKGLEELYEAGLIKMTGELRVEENIFKKEYKFYGKIDYFLDPDAAQITDAQKKQVLSLYDTSGLKAQFKVRLPGNLYRHDGELENGMLSYVTSYDDNQTRDIHVITQIKNKTISTVIIIAAIVFAAVAFVFVSRKLKEAKEKKKSRELYGEDDVY